MTKKLFNKKPSDFRIIKKLKFLNHKILLSIFYLFIFAILLENSFNYLDSDFGWHLKVGQEILENKSIPHINHYNFTLNEVKWVDHEWLINTFMYFIYDRFGYIILSLIFAGLILFTIIYLNRHVLKNYSNKDYRLFFIMLFTYLGVEAMSPHLGVRVQEISILFLLLLYLIIYFYTKKKNKTILFWLPPLFFLWSNLHGGFLLGITLMFFWLGIKIIEFLIIKYNYQNRKYFDFINFEQTLSIKNLFIFFIVAVCSVLSTLLTPYGLKLYSFLFSYKDTYYLSHITEWLPFYNYPFLYQQLLFLGFVFAALLISIYYSQIKKNKKYKLKLWELATILLFFYFALKSKRHFPLFFISAYPFLISFFHKFFQPMPKKNFFAKYKNITSFFIAINLVLFACFFIVNTKFTNFPFKKYNNKYPYMAVQFLKNNPQYDQQKLFNYYSWGGYLIWTYPERKLFIDGRLPQYNYGGHSILEEYFNFFDEDKSKKMLDKHNISLVLLKKNYPIKFNFFEKYFLGLSVVDINQKDDQLITHLEKTDSWQKIYEDNISLIFSQN